jgi:threonyl-tRNA synthetase
LQLLTEQFRRLIQENISFETLSMVPSVAESFLKKKQPVQAELAANFPLNVVPLCKVKDFYDICPEELLATSRDIQHFVLYELLALPDSCVRIRGAAFHDKKQLKTFVKQVEVALQADPVLFADRELVSISDGMPVWHPQGMVVKKRLESWCEKMVGKAGYLEISCPAAAAGAQALFTQYQKQNRALPYRFFLACEHQGEASEGLFQTEWATGLTLFSSCLTKDVQHELISSLQFMEQMASILPSECHFVFLQRGKAEGNILESVLSSLGYSFDKERSDCTGCEVRASDLRGRTWAVSRLSLRLEPQVQIELQLILSYERILALLLERQEGYLPFWLAPEQVRILPVDSECTLYAEEVLLRLQQEGLSASIDMSRSGLREKMFQVSQSRVPCVIVIGKNELQSKKLALRFMPHETQSQALDEADVITNLKGRKRQTLESESRDSSSESACDNTHRRTIRRIDSA